MNKDIIANKVFTRAFLGYDAAEVDVFLDEVIREYERMRQELDVARLRNKMLLDELERFRTQPTKEPEPDMADQVENPDTAATAPPEAEEADHIGA